MVEDGWIDERSHKEIFPDGLGVEAVGMVPLADGDFRREENYKLVVCR